MRRSLLILACSLAVGATAYAAPSEPMKFADKVFVGLSANGRWAVSADEYMGTFAIVDLDTGQSWDYGEYRAGKGRCASDDGTIIANEVGTENGLYWQDGEWHTLPKGPADWGLLPNAITPDGSVIVGSVGRDTEGGTTVPVLWQRNSEGAYDPYIELPYPELDFTGRTPQYVLIDDVSADGTVMACDLVDYFGGMHQPMVISRDSNGRWSYTLVQDGILNPDGLTFPEWPGESPELPTPEMFMTPENAEAYLDAIDAYWAMPYPDPMQFMTDEEYAAWWEAFQAYEADWEHNPYPDPADYLSPEGLAAYQAALDAYTNRVYPEYADFMTAEELAAYEAAKQQYDADLAEWMPKFIRFSNVYDKILTNPDIPVFEMNSARISANGRYYLLTANHSFADPNSWTGYSSVAVPYVFDLEADEYYVLENGVGDVYATQVFDNGAVIGGAPAADYARSAVISESLNAPFVGLKDIIEERDEPLYAWMSENMGASGTPVATPDLSVFATWVMNLSDNPDEPLFYSYAFPVEGLSGIRSVVADRDSAAGVRLLPDGTLTVAGSVEAVDIFDPSGRLVFSLKHPANGTATALAPGLYIVRAAGTATKARVL